MKYVQLLILVPEQLRAQKRVW